LTVGLFLFREQFVNAATGSKARSDTGFTFTSESVSEGHPDKVADYIADSILDAHLAQDARARVACEVLVKSDKLVIAGEITSGSAVDAEAVARAAIREVGYATDGEPFHADTVQVSTFLTQQSREIAEGVNSNDEDMRHQGAGDQGIMFGFATDETPELMPLPILLAHRLTHALSSARTGDQVPWLRPDAKTQVSVEYEGEGKPIAVTHVLVSTQHSSEVGQADIYDYLATSLIPATLGEWFTSRTQVIANPSGSFLHGGPSADCGVTGRKIIADTYGGAGRHGGGAFSGKDPSKVDRSGAYFCRFVARQLVMRGLARMAEIQVSYAIGRPEPVSLRVNTFDTGDQRAAVEFASTFDFRPGEIVKKLNLLQPIYAGTTNYGHFGRGGFSWEC
jgi:S-adenosylmethionine synthetase